jgi:hypothetical protein
MINAIIKKDKVDGPIVNLKHISIISPTINAYGIVALDFNARQEIITHISTQFNFTPKISILFKKHS